MQIEEEVLKTWKALYTAGDAGKMAKKVENGYPEIFTRALREGKCNDDIHRVMKTFFTRKAKKLKAYV